MVPHAQKLPVSVEGTNIDKMTKQLYSKHGRADEDVTASLLPLFKENNLAKMINVAQTLLGDHDTPTIFPETIPQTGPNRGVYQCRDPEFWTCGFFPGSLYCLLERMRKYPAASLAGLSILSELNTQESQRHSDILLSHLTDLCQKWSAPLHAMSARTDTHDLGFIVQPAVRRYWELFRHKQSLNSLLTAAESLASRFDERVGAIRSWDRFCNARTEITSMEDDFLFIIDSMCNLDLLFFAGNYLQCPRLLHIASTHATTLLSTHLRRELETAENGIKQYSTYHVVNFSPSNNGAVKRKLTAQGYSDTSTWARGQAWAILGYAQTFTNTKRREFLDVAIGLAEYFICRLESAPEVVEELEPGGDGHRRGRYVPLWDFDAPITDTADNPDRQSAPLRDVSAGMIAANGLLILYTQLIRLGDIHSAHRYLEYVMRIVNDTVALAYNDNEMCLRIDKQTGGIRVEACGQNRFDAILARSTANFNADHPHRFWNHGLVYADYYFLELGNRLCDMGLV